MKRIFYDVPLWSIYLHRRERGLPRAGRLDPALHCFQDEIFEKLFNGSDQLTNLFKPEKRFKNQLKQLEYAHGAVNEMIKSSGIADQCAHDATKAAFATQWIMDSFEVHTKTQPSSQNQQQQGDAQDASKGLEGVDTEGKGTEGNLAEHEKYDPADVERVQRVAELIKDDERLKRIALLAGKFKRIMLTKQKSKVKHETDEVAEIEQGGELTRLLPFEYARLISKKFNLAFKADLLERKCMQYSMTAKEPLARGPIVLCVDKSGSMQGDRDIWSTAIGLALLDMAHRQKRTFILLGFNDDVFQKCVVRVGKSIPIEHLCVQPDGGTDIAKVLDLAVLATETSALMNRADVILITDGQSDPTQAEWIKGRAKSKEVTITGVGIGVPLEHIQVWCDEDHAYTVEDLGRVDEEVAADLFSK